MTNDLTPMQSFEEKVKGKLKETIADMLPDEALQALVQKAVEETFFKRRSTQDRNGYTREEKPWFVEEVAKLAEPIIQAQAQRAFEANKERVEEAVAKFIDQQNIAMIMAARIGHEMSGSIASAIMRVMQLAQSGTRF